ncbi:MAG: hypothetical protein HC828_19380, partial [Blastochloris sp.]|nr:hypothetical protein [Blastochloris sp.]
TRTVPNDFWWHLKAGELIATSGLPTTNIFAWSLPADTPYVYQSWLAEWLFYVLYQLGGLPLVIFARNVLATGAIALVAYEAHRRSGSWWLAGSGALLLIWMIINNLTTRTQNWSWIPFMLLFILLSRYADKTLGPRWLAAVPLLLLFWVNAHGAFSIGLLMIGAFVAGETLRGLLRQPDAPGWQRLRWLYLAAFGALLATFLNPLGPGVYTYVYDLLTDAPSQQLVNEWQPPSPRDLAGMGFFVSVILLLFAVALGRRRPALTDMLLVGGYLWMAFSGVRYVVWFGFVAMPVLAQVLTAPPAERAQTRFRKPATIYTTNLLLAAGFVLLLLVVQPWFKPLLPLPAEYRALFADVPGAPVQFSADTPVGATEHLLEQPCAGHLFNEMGFGSYLIWALYPQGQVFIDPRVELYPLAQWEDYRTLSRGEDVMRLFEQYQIQCVLLGTDEQPTLAAAMASLPDWTRTYQDEQSEVWRHRR